MEMGEMYVGAAFKRRPELAAASLYPLRGGPYIEKQRSESRERTIRP